MSVRIVSIQHGDYREALQILASGITEPYFGMRYSVDALENFIGDNPHLIISLDTPSSYSERRGVGELIGVPRPKLPRPIPGRVSDYLMASQILKKIEEFRPTHVLLRTGMTSIFSRVLRLCKVRRYNTMVIFATYLSNENPRARRFNHFNTSLLNEPFVFRVGNHKWPATQSLIESGLDPAKAIAWDWPRQREACDFPVKELSPPPFTISYVGTITFAKGVSDLLDAAAILHSRGVRFRLHLLGAGTDLDALKQKASALPDGLVEFKGRLPNSEAFQVMKESSLVVVPSRHVFPEGLPLTLTEGLASRTPLIVSDHPVLVRAFQDGEGLRFFKASDPVSLATKILEVLDDPAEYRRLSGSTADALERVRCPNSFGDLLDQWKESYSNDPARPGLT